MPPRKSRNSQKNAIGSPLRSPKTVKKNAKSASEKNASKNLIEDIKSAEKVAEEQQQQKETPKETKQQNTPKKKNAKATKGKAPASKDNSAAAAAAPAVAPAASSLVSSKLLNSAVDELVKYSERQIKEQQEKESKNGKAKLFDSEDYNDETVVAKDLDLVIQFKKFLSSDLSLKPKLIKLAHSLYPIDNKAKEEDEEASEVTDFKICLIVRDGVITSEEELEKIEQAKIPFLSKILPFQELYKEYKTYDKKRQLLKSYDLFLADDGVITNLPSILGKTFYQTYKAPIPIKIVSSTNLKSSDKKKQFSIETAKNKINQVLNSVSYLLPVSSNITIKVGNVSKLSKQENLDNLLLTLNHFEDSKFNNKESNAIRAVYLKLRSSPALPLYYDETLYLSESDVVEKNDKDAAATKEAKEDAVETDKEYIVGNEQVIAKGVKLSKFEQSLLELGQFEEKPEFLQKKLKNAEKQKNGKKRTAEDANGDKKEKDEKKDDVSEKSDKKNADKTKKRKKTKA